MVVAATQAETDSLSLYVHCAALAVTGGALDIDPARLSQAIAVNATSMIPLTQGLLPVLRPGSNVIYVSSRGAQSVVRSYVALGPSKSLGEASIRSEEHTSELQSLMRISYAVFCLKKKNINKQHTDK